MAINDIENPEEEGTPKSKSEIRKERRQMKSINRQRKAMGGKPLYVEEDFEAIKKPYQGGPGEIVAGTPVVEDTTPDVEYIKYESGGYNPVSKERFEQEKKIGFGSGSTNKDYESYLKNLEKKSTTSSTGTLKGGTQEAQDVFSATEGDEQAGLRVAKVLENTALNDDTKTLEQKKEAVDASKVVQKEIENTNQQIDNQVKESTQDQTTIIPPSSVAGDGSNVAKIVNQVEPGKTDWTLSEPAIEFSPTSRDDIYAQAKLAKTKVPQLAIEKLGVQDYYPEIGRDIAVGNFSGSYAGSRTIFSGAGGLLPLGLYDARKRAIAAEIKKKEAIMDQIKEIPDIAKQFKTEYSQEYMNFLSPWLNAYKDKPEALLSNTDFLKDMNHYKSVAENFIKVDSDLRKFEELVQPKDGKPAAYATNGMLEILHKFKAGFLPGKTNDWLTGKKNISKLTETVQAIPNGYNWADDKVKVLLEKGQAEIPIYPKDGVEWNSMTEEDKSKIRNDVNGLVVSLQDGSPDYETYLTSLKKYFHFDFETMADEWVKGTSLNALSPKEKEEYRKSLAVYMLKNMPPDSIVNKIDTVANKAAEREDSLRDYQAAMARINADTWMFQQEYEKHNSATRAQIEAMEQGGFNQTALKSSEVKINPDNTGDKEYKVWFFTLDKKGNKNFKQDYVSATEIKRNPNMYFNDNKASSFFEVPSTGYFGVNQNVVTKEGNNYNGQQYGTMFEVVGKDAEGRNIYEPSETQWRSRKATIKKGGVYEAAAEQTYNTSVGQNPAWQAADTEGRGATVKEKAGGKTYTKTPQQ